MSIYQHKNSPFWQFEFQIRGYRFSGSTKTADKRRAAEIEKAEKDRARGIIERIAAGAGEPMTIETACNRWWNEHGRDLNDPHIKPRLDWIVETIGPRTPLHSISDDTVSRLVAARRLDVRRSGTADGRQLYRPITNNTINKTTIALLRRVLRRARDNWNAAIIREPVWKKHVLKETKRPVRELTAAEETTLDAIERPEYAAIRRFAIITGLRRRNLLLTWSQVDFELGVIRIITKGGIPRVLPLTREAYQILWSCRGHHPEFVFTYVCQKSRRIPKGQALRIKGERYPISYSGLGSNKRSWARAGVDARIHDLRHTTGMRVLRQTGNLKAVQKILGHTDIAITAKFYTDATVDDMRAAMESASAVAAPIEPKLIDNNATSKSSRRESET